MSATSGIGISQQLAQQFSSAVDSKSTRFIKISIQNESLVHDLSVPVSGSFHQDLSSLQEILQEDTPAYVLAQLDDQEWLAIFYVPDSAKVRDKMLYASSRASLMKSLGSNLFTDSLFATSKSDLTPEAYKAHRKHVTAPQPLSAREKEMAEVRAAEREAGGGSYEGSRARASPIGTGVGLNVSPEVETAIQALGEQDGTHLLVIKIDTSSETLVLESSSDVRIESLHSALPQSEPCYSLFSWPQQNREIVFIYSCPSSSPIKHRMLYSSGSSGVFQSAKALLSSSSWTLAGRKIETSDPSELNEEFLKSELAVTANSSNAGNGEQRTSFARPKGPARKR